jgi:hypothetical protein
MIINNIKINNQKIKNILLKNKRKDKVMSKFLKINNIATAWKNFKIILWVMTLKMDRSK